MPEQNHGLGSRAFKGLVCRVLIFRVISNPHLLLSLPPALSTHRTLKVAPDRPVIEEAHVGSLFRRKVKQESILQLVA